MESKERLLLALLGKSPDRHPVAPFIHGNFVKSFFKNATLSTEEVFNKTIDLHEYFGFDMIHRNLEVRFHFENISSAQWDVEKTIDTFKTYTTETISIKTPEKELFQKCRFDQITPYLKVKSIVSSFVKEKDDFDQFVKYFPSEKIIQENIQIPQALSAIGNRGILAPWAFGLFNFVAEIRGLEQILMDLFLDPDLYHSMMTFFSGILESFYLNLAKTGIEAISYPGNLANGTTLGLEIFTNFVLPYEQAMIQFIQSHNMSVIYHNCGNAKNLIPAYNKINMNCFETLTQPPHGDIDIAYALDKFDPSICLMVNIDQIDLLTKGTPSQIKSKVQDLQHLISNRNNFIISTSDFLEEDTPEENIWAIMQGLGY